MVDQRQRGKPKSPTATAHGFAIDQQKQQRQRQRIKTVANGFVLLVLVFVFVFVTPIFVPTRESFYDFCVQRKLVRSVIFVDLCASARFIDFDRFGSDWFASFLKRSK
jgi:hypothetical protein